MRGSRSWNGERGARAPRGTLGKSRQRQVPEPEADQVVQDDPVLNDQPARRAELWVFRFGVVLRDRVLALRRAGAPAVRLVTVPGSVLKVDALVPEPSNLFPFRGYPDSEGVFSLVGPPGLGDLDGA